MQIQTEQEAMYLACEMETTAIALYTRALKLMEALGRQDEPLYGQLALMLSDEEEHLRQFRSLYTGLDTSQEQQILLSAIAEGVLFEGGLMGAARQGLLKDTPSMLRLAMDAEATSMRKYREFAELAGSDAARAALNMIASEEERHWNDLQQQVEGA